MSIEQIQREETEQQALLADLNNNNLKNFNTIEESTNKTFHYTNNSNHQKSQLKLSKTFHSSMCMTEKTSPPNLNKFKPAAAPLIEQQSELCEKLSEQVLAKNFASVDTKAKVAAYISKNISAQSYQKLDQILEVDKEYPGRIVCFDTPVNFYFRLASKEIIHVNLVKKMEKLYPLVGCHLKKENN